MTIAALMRPLQYNLRDPAAKDNSIKHAAMAPSNLDTATTMRSADSELQNTVGLRAKASEIATPNSDPTPKQKARETNEPECRPRNLNGCKGKQNPL